MIGLLDRLVADFLGLLLLASGLSKLRAPARFADQVVAFELLPAWASRALAYAIPPAEAVVGLALLLPVPPLPGRAAAAALLLLFTAFAAWALAARRTLSCFCFGEDDGRISGLTLARNAMLTALAALAGVLAWAVAAPAPAVLDRILSGVHAASALLVFLAGFELASLRSGDLRRAA